MQRAAAVVALVVLAAAPAFAGSVAYVDYARLVSEAPQSTASRALVRKEFADRRKDVMEKQSEVKRLRQQFAALGPGTNPLKRAAVVEQLRHARSALRNAGRAYETRLSLRESQLEAAFEKLVKREIAAYAQAHGFDVVLRDDVIFAAPGTDITDAVLARLKRDYQKARTEGGKQ